MYFECKINTNMPWNKILWRLCLKCQLEDWVGHSQKVCEFFLFWKMCRFYKNKHIWGLFHPVKPKF